MDPIHFTCPCCTARLRVRDPLSIGRQVECPECRKPLLISERRDDATGDRWEVAPIPESKAKGIVTSSPARPLGARSASSEPGVAPSDRKRGPQIAETPASTAAVAIKATVRKASTETLTPPVVTRWGFRFVGTSLAAGCCAVALFGWWAFRPASPETAVDGLPEETKGSASANVVFHVVTEERATASSATDATPIFEGPEPDANSTAEPPVDPSLVAEIADGSANDLAPTRDTPAGDSVEADELEIEPLEPEFGPEPLRKPFNLAEALRQPIVLFDMPRARPLVEWLPGLSDMVGAPIRFDESELGASAGGLKMMVRIRLEKTSVGEILETALKPAGLTYRLEKDHLRLAPR